jgi:predicted TIM-barrel enzyme
LGQAIAIALAEAGADAIIAHVGTTVGGSIGVKGAVCTMEDARCCYRHGR